MSHMEFNTNLKDTLKSDNELKTGPLPRWQRRAREQGLTPLSINEKSFLGNKSGLGISPRSARTPLSGSFLDGKKSPSTGISPGREKSPARLMPKLAVRGHRTPGGGNKTPNKLACGDRFIPNRSATDYERSHHLIMSSMDRKDTNADDEQSLQQKEYREKMLQNLNDGVPPETRVLSFKAKAPQGKDGSKSSQNFQLFCNVMIFISAHINNLKVLFSTGKSATKSSSSRHIPSVPEKILDAPELLNDYYLHLMDWSSNNHLAVGLGGCVFIWNGGDGTITPLTQYEDPEYICSLSWIKEGNVLAIGRSNKNTELWDVAQQKLIRTMAGHTDRITSLSWNSFILSSGSRSGQIIHHDVRNPNHISATLNHHSQEICGLKWSNDGRMLAAGGNDNLVSIWENGSTTPLFTFSDHQAAVKGLAWCPFQNNILASGGGTNDRTIRLWNCSLGTNLKTVNTNSQVSSLLWSTHYRELISGHGFSQNQLTIWKYPTLTKVTDLTGHTGRVLEMCLSPDGQTVVSAAADETLRLWKCWAVDKKEKKSLNIGKDHPISALARTIR
ncbi:Cell division cycle protein 20-like protein [Armadillidium nasatum]|uniref:Cell division cycle protein 20-like protein n=1 Tax=Armadillidium nasatum TaxID=96803 RepID=A0A5N5SKU6_9CRUS|nr:Cell division cycle protein 20-like protein [Armadillidium nasatum]